MFNNKNKNVHNTVILVGLKQEKLACECTVHFHSHNC